MGARGGSKKNRQSAKDKAYYTQQYGRTERNLKRKGKTNKKQK
jgi:hypothetical protein